MTSTTLTIRLDQEEKDFIAAYAMLNRKSVAAVVLESVLDRIEDEMDIRLYNKAKAEFEKDPVTYSHEEVGRELGLL